MGFPGWNFKISTNFICVCWLKILFLNPTVLKDFLAPDFFKIFFEGLICRRPSNLLNRFPKSKIYNQKIIFWFSPLRVSSLESHNDRILGNVTVSHWDLQRLYLLPRILTFNKFPLVKFLTVIWQFFQNFLLFFDFSDQFSQSSKNDWNPNKFQICWQKSHCSAVLGSQRKHPVVWTSKL